MKKLLMVLFLLLNSHCSFAAVTISSVRDLTEDTSPSRNDIGYSVKDPASVSWSSRKVKWGTILDLSGWTLTNNVITSTKNVSTTGTITASQFIGDGSQLTGISGAGASPGGSGSELQYRSGANTLGGVTGSVVSGGNVGIGTTPAVALSVLGTIRASTDIKIGSNSVCQSTGTNCPSAGAETDPVVKALNGIVKANNGGTITAVTAPTGTIVGTTDSQSLTNKTINGANNTISGITESMLSTSNVTTLDVSTVKHGFAPILPNDATKYLDGTGSYSVPAGSGGAGGWTDGGTNVYTSTTTDNVGVGTTTPGSGIKLDVRGGPLSVWTGSGTNTNATSAGEAYIQGDLEVDGTSYITNLGSATQLNSKQICLQDGTNCPAAAGNGWTDGGTNVYPSTTTDQIGLGTTTPSGTLEIVKQSGLVPLMVSNTATGDGDYLIVTTAGNVGIGTVLPGTPLDVNGQVRATSYTINGAAGTTQFANANGISFDPNHATFTTGVVNMTSGGNVGIGTVTAGKLLTIGSTGQASVDSSGNVITSGSLTLSGISGSTQCLHVNSSGVVSGTASDCGAGGGSGGWTDGGTTIYNTTTSDSVGIGITAVEDSAKLEVVDTSSANPVIAYFKAGDGSSSTETTANIYLEANSNDNGAVTAITAGFTAGIHDTGAYMSLATRNNISDGSAIAERLRINNKGNVGIGTTSPEGAFIIRSSTTDIGWRIVAAGNQACNTTCASACVFGIDIDSTTNSLLNCTDAAADRCLCAGSN